MAQRLSDNPIERKEVTMKLTRKDLLLYAVTDRHWLGKETLSEQVEKALRGGATFIQLREKNMEKQALLEEAREIQSLCREYGVPFVINDYADFAAEIGADGVHVGQKDLAGQDVRKIIGPDKILGVSAKTVEQAKAAEAMGADYLGVGAVFETGSKEDAAQISHETVEEICKAVNIPVIGIGGITGENVELLSGRGLCGVAVISAIFGRTDIEKATAELKEKVKEMVEGR